MAEYIDFPGESVVGRRSQAPATEIGALFDRVAPAAYSEIPEGRVTGPLTAVYHSFTGGVFDVTIGFPTAWRPGTDAGVTVLELPGGPALRTVHTGPYDTLREAYDNLERAARERGATPAVAVERYLTDPGVNPDPATWQTEVLFLLAAGPAA